MPHLAIIKYKKNNSEEKQKPVQYVGLVIPTSDVKGSANLTEILKKEMSDDLRKTSHPFHLLKYGSSVDQVFDQVVEAVMEHNINADKLELHLIAINDSKETIENRFGLTAGKKPSVANLKSFFEEVAKNYVGSPDGFIKISEVVFAISQPKNMQEMMMLMAFLGSLQDKGFHPTSLVSTADVMRSLSLPSLSQVRAPSTEVSTSPTTTSNPSTPTVTPEELVTTQRKMR